MDISIFGLGYVGCVSLGCLAKNGHNMIGVDLNSDKVNLINKGMPTILEKDIDLIIKEQFDKGNIRATLDPAEAVLNSSVSIVCVGTPSSVHGHLNLSYIYKTAEQIGAALTSKNEFHTVVIRSTVLPGTNQKFVDIIGQVSGKADGQDFAVVSNPEFLREGSAVHDYFNPPVIVLGGTHRESLKNISRLYESLNVPIEITEVKIAELIKYVNNSFHALKITFANEVGNICKALSIDSHNLMELFCKDAALNISKAYLKPGFAFGGSCLPKDLRGLVTLAHDHYLATPLLATINRSNDQQKKNALEMVLKTNQKNICLFGISFKEGTDDLRFSPGVELAETLLGKGFSLKIYDENVRISNLIGFNKYYIQDRIPHLADIIVDDLYQAILQSEVVIINQTQFDASEYFDLLKDKHVIDLVRIKRLKDLPQYEGLSW